jgi:hypothetical protein
MSSLTIAAELQDVITSNLGFADDERGILSVQTGILGINNTFSTTR